MSSSCSSRRRRRIRRRSREMELGGGDSDRFRESTRSSPLGIDLNEIPSSSESFDVVRTYHDVPDLPPEPAADAVVALGASSCGACGRPEADGGRVVVCDGCERGFHTVCTGMPGLGDVAGEVEWVCLECTENGKKSQGWPLGFKLKRKPVFDMNASPPRDGDAVGEAGVGSVNSRKRSLGDNSFGGNPFGSSARYPNLYRARSGFGFDNASGVLMHDSGAGFRDIRHHALMRCKGFEVGIGFPVEDLKGSNNSVFRFPRHNQSEFFLLALREYISQRHGILEEGWHVELKQSNSGMHAIYYAPNGAKFDSMSAVASHLGLPQEQKESESIAGSQGSLLLEKIHLSRKRKPARSPAANGFSESKEFLLHTFYKEFNHNSRRMEAVASDHGNMAKVAESGSEDDIDFNSQRSNDGLPVQFEDFFLLSLGTIDSRPSYHGSDRLWPICYRSCWHDKITGSLFFCDVLDGGESGPLFKIRRCSCSAEPMPIGTTVVVRQYIEPSAFREGEESGSFNSTMEVDIDENMQGFLSDPIPPTEDEISNCIGINSSKACDFPSDSMQIEASCGLVKSGALRGKLEVKDELGEIVVEGRSSILAWKEMSQKLVDAFSDIWNRKCSVQLFCQHVEHETFSPKQDIMDSKCELIFGTSEKFQSLLISGHVLSNEYNHDISSEVVRKWWGQDRFGLDLDFVQEMMEQLPHLEVCSHYELLNKRRNHAKLLTFTNGSLLVTRNDGTVIKEEEVLDSLLRRSKRAKIVDDQRRPPSGTLLCQRLSSELVGDCYQIWEILWRFHEILGLKETFSLEELEEELTSSQLSTTNHGRNFEGKKLSTLSGTGIGSGPSLSYSDASTRTDLHENSWAPVPAESTSLKECTNSHSSTIRRSTCRGLSLTKVHSALLTVLIGELQSKVAAIVDPTSDGSESKPKRRRKKDADSTNHAKRNKLNMLPINELSWPELARRYILSILSMDGNSDSAEVIARESSKVFRCLQGDGGLLCGSLTGIAGIEADALLLAEASTQIFGFSSRGDEVFTIEGEESAQSSACEIGAASEHYMPDWAKALEPVKKLPTNVGTRIRKCVYDALNKQPPEWARKILEHSISKEIYKGNASGPTKKAVLSVLADASSDRLPQKPDDDKRRNTVVTVSDILMKQCRTVLRQAAAVDDSKVLCNLLGRNLVNSSDNDDEGLIGSPAMVSRPLDFRTIDLRLSAGAYGGSHEAFLEDVHELWENLRVAFGDQPDLVELTDKLSENFQSFYEEKVVPVVDQLGGYKDLESLDAEKKKELTDLVSSISVLPKAPWDEGVCKVCGVDKDDDSVLLCDTCDAEYHTYCLNPPLSRIPEGNWYCPSCVAGRRVTLDGSAQTPLIRGRRGRRYQGDVTSDYLEALSHLAFVMEEKEYWEYSVEERIFLLKFLCDELLNSALIRQHLEQCAETSLELQQKLRNLSLECKALKSREEFLAGAINADAVIIDRVAEALKEGLASTRVKNGSLMLGRQSERSNHMSIVCELQTENAVEKLSFTTSKSSLVSDGQITPPSEITGEPEDDENAKVDGKLKEDLPLSQISINNAKPSGSSEPPTSDPETEELKESQGDILPVGRNNVLAPLPDSVNEAQIWQAELNSVKNEISRVQTSMSSLRSQFLKLSIRREFLGSDSLGRLYWAAAVPGDQLRFIVDGSLTTNIREDTTNLSSSQDDATLVRSKAHCPYRYELNDAVANYPPLISYQSEAEIKELVRWLRDNDPKERAVKDAILHWEKFRSQDSQDCAGRASNKSLVAPSDHPTVGASIFLESKYGPCVDSLSHEMLNKHEEKGHVSSEEKVCRCKCLEPVLPGRFHCLSCHKTFLSMEDLEAHKEGKCSSASEDHEKGKGIFDCSREKPFLEKSTCLKPSSKLIRYQNEGTMCPHDIDEISSKFITKDSNRELVKQIGLIGSNGVPSFVPSRFSYLDDAKAMVFPESGAAVLSRDLVDFDGSFTSSEKKTFPMSRMFDGLNARTASEKSASKNHSRATSRCHKEKEGASRDIPSCRCVVPSVSLRPLLGEASTILRRLKINLLDMEAAVPEEAFRPSKAHMERRWAWRSFVKSAGNIFEMVQATFVLEDMIKTQYLRSEWWYWSSLSVAAKTSTITSLALRIYSLDSCIIYEKNYPISDSADNCKTDSVPDQKPESASDVVEKPKPSRKSTRKRKELDG